jgi:hypothetical protein
LGIGKEVGGDREEEDEDEDGREGFIDGGEDAQINGQEGDEREETVRERRRPFSFGV